MMKLSFREPFLKANRENNWIYSRVYRMGTLPPIGTSPSADTGTFEGLHTTGYRRSRVSVLAKRKPAKSGTPSLTVLLKSETCMFLTFSFSARAVSLMAKSAPHNKNKVMKEDTLHRKNCLQTVSSIAHPRSDKNVRFCENRTASSLLCQFSCL